MNATHDPQRQSWVASANRPACAFPIQNLPFGVFQTATHPAIGVAIGDQILDLRGCCRAGLLSSLAPETREACAAATLNLLMAASQECWSPLRAGLSDLLRADHPHAADHQRSVAPPIFAQWQKSPCSSPPPSATIATSMHRSITPRIWVSLPAGQSPAPQLQICPDRLSRTGIVDCCQRHTRAASGLVRVSPAAGPPPHFAPTQALDYEIEAGFFVGPGNNRGEVIAIDRAPSHLFGVCLLNDWTARDVQAWEYQPLGPFLAKSFATSISPWVVTMEALAPFRTPAYTRPAEDPSPLAYLDSEEDRRQGGIDLTLEVYLRSARMRATGCDAVRLSRGNLGYLYWTPAQLLTHHASNGCNLQPSDLLGSGTVSGPSKESLGCFSNSPGAVRSPSLYRQVSSAAFWRTVMKSLFADIVSGRDL